MEAGLKGQAYDAAPTVGGAELRRRFVFQLAVATVNGYARWTAWVAVRLGEPCCLKRQKCKRHYDKCRQIVEHFELREVNHI